MMGRLIGRILLLFFLSLPSLAHAATGSAAADTWYVRPTASCTNNGDGLAYACAASGGATGAFKGFANIIWTGTVGVDDDDTLYVCGAHLTMLAVGGGGTVNHPIVVRGDCPSDAGTIDTHGLTDITDAIQIENLNYVSVLNFSSLTGNRFAIHFRSDGALLHGFVINGNTVDNRTAATATNGCHGIAATGTGTFTDVTVTHNTILGTSATCAGQNNNDAINLERQTGPLVVAYNNSTNSGDGIDISGPIVNGAEVYGNSSHHNRLNGIKIHGGTGCPTGVHVYGNLFVNNGYWGMVLQDSVGSTLANNTVIHFHDGVVGGLQPWGALSTELVNVPGTCSHTNNSYRNNIFTGNYNIGLAVHYTGTRASFEANNVTNGNVYYQRGVETALIGFVADSSNAVTTSNLATWQLTHPLDQVATPEFLNATACTGETTITGCDASDFRLIVSSPLHRAGVSTAACLDLRGRPCGFPPDLGAYQTSSRDPAQPRAARQ